MSKTKRIFFTIFHYLEYFFLGFLIGFVIGFYQWIFSYLQKLGFSLVKESYGLFILSLGIFILAIIGFSLYLKNPYFRGNGTTVALKIRYGLLNKAKSRESITYIFWSIIGSFFLLPLGSEGPSVFLGTSLYGNITKERKDNSGLGGGAAFGAALNCPLGGAVYAFEEMKAPINLSNILKVILLCIGSSLIPILVFTEPLFEFDFFTALNYHSLAWLLLFFVLTFGAVYSCICLQNTLDYFFKNHQSKIFTGIKFFFPFFLYLILLFFFPTALGKGMTDFSTLFGKDLLLLGLTYFVIRYLLNLFFHNGGVPGGMLTPTLVAGLYLGVFLTGLIEMVIPQFPSENLAFFIFFTAFLYLALMNKIPSTAGIVLFNLLLRNHVAILDNLLFSVISLAFFLLGTYLLKKTKITNPLERDIMLFNLRRQENA